MYILLKCTQVWIELGLLVKALLAWGIYCGRCLGKTTFLELCMNLGCMTNMWKNNEQKCGLDWIANTYLIIFVVLFCYNFPNLPWDNVFVCLPIEKGIEYYAEKEFKIQGQWPRILSPLWAWKPTNKTVENYRITKEITKLSSVSNLKTYRLRNVTSTLLYF